MDYPRFRLQMERLAILKSWSINGGNPLMATLKKPYRSVRRPMIGRILLALSRRTPTRSDHLKEHRRSLRPGSTLKARMTLAIFTPRPSPVGCGSRRSTLGITKCGSGTSRDSRQRNVGSEPANHLKQREMA